MGFDYKHDTLLCFLKLSSVGNIASQCPHFITTWKSSLLPIMNENLNWKCHVNNIANKISKSIGILNKLKHFVPLNAKVLIYDSLILSHLNFCILTWATSVTEL